MCMVEQYSSSACPEGKQLVLTHEGEEEQRQIMLMQINNGDNLNIDNHDGFYYDSIAWVGQ